MKTKLMLLAGSFVLLLNLVSPLAATTVRRKNFTELVQQADLVAIGRVINVQSFPTVDKRYVYTYVTVDELDVLKGVAEDSALTLRMDGGDVGDGRRLLIPGVPKFQIGEQVVIFVKDNGRSICPLVGWEQGLLHVDKNERGGETLVKSSRNQRIHGIKNGAFMVGAGDKHSQQQEGVYIVDAPRNGSGGRTDQAEETQSQTQELSVAEQAQDLTLARLKSEVRSLLGKSGYRKSASIPVRSAQIEFAAPAGRRAAPKN